MRPATALVFALLCLPVGADAQELELSLNQAVDLAMVRAVEIAQQRENARQSVEQLGLSLTAFEPRASVSWNRDSARFLSTFATETDEIGYIESASRGWNVGLDQRVPGGGHLSVGYSQNRSTTNSANDLLGESYHQRMNISFSQPLLDGFLFDDSMEGILEARSARRRTWQQLHNHVLDLVAQVESAYWSVSRSEADLRTAEDSLEYAISQEKLTQLRVDEGFAAPAELLQVAEQVASRRSEVLSARAILEADRDALRRLLLIPVEDWGRTLVLVDAPEDPIVGLLEPGPDLLPESEVLALEGNTDLAVARESLRRAREHMRARASDLLPDLSLQGGWWTSGVGANPAEAAEELSSGDSTGWSIGLSLNTGLSLTRDRVDFNRARRAMKLAEQQLHGMEARLRERVRQAVRDLELARNTLELSYIRRDLAERKLEAEEERVSRGSSTLKNLLDFLADRDRATRAQSAAAIGVRRAVLQLRALRGDLLQSRGIDLEQVLGVRAPS
jgi:outer membrane protein TolC